MDTANTTTNQTSVIPDMRNFADLSAPQYPQNVNWEALENFVIGQKPDCTITQPVDERTTTAKQVITNLQGYYMYNRFPCERFQKEGTIAAARAVHDLLKWRDFEVVINFCRSVFAQRLSKDEDAREIGRKYLHHQYAKSFNSSAENAEGLSDGENFFFGFKYAFQHSIYLLELADKGEINNKSVQRWLNWTRDVAFSRTRAARLKRLRKHPSARWLLSPF